MNRTSPLAFAGLRNIHQVSRAVDGSELDVKRIGTFKVYQIIVVKFGGTYHGTKVCTNVEKLMPSITSNTEHAEAYLHVTNGVRPVHKDR